MGRNYLDGRSGKDIGASEFKPQNYKKLSTHKKNKEGREKRTQDNGREQKIAEENKVSGTNPYGKKSLVCWET